MTLDLSGVEAKIDRAYEHLQALHAEIESWAASDPYSFRAEIRDEGREHSATLLIHRDPDSPRFGLLVGDCAQNLRSALDHLVYAVAKDVLPEEKFAKAEEGLQFPICTSSGAWQAALERGRLCGIEGPVLAAIEKRQPYKTVDMGDTGGSKLAALHWLNNRDKHRVLHAVAAFASMAEVRFIPELPGPNEGRIAEPPYEHGTEIVWVRTAQPTPHMQVMCDLAVEIRVRDSPLEEDIRVSFRKIGQLVRRIVLDVTEAHQAPSPPKG